MQNYLLQGADYRLCLTASARPPPHSPLPTSLPDLISSVRLSPQETNPLFTIYRTHYPNPFSGAGGADPAVGRDEPAFHC